MSEQPDQSPGFGEVADPDDLLDGCPSQDEEEEEPPAPPDVDS